MTENKLWGWDLAIDGGCCNPLKIRDAENIKAFSKELVEKIDMVAYGDPIIKEFGEGNKHGITAIQLIMTSCIVIHFVDDETRSGYFDIFSCKEYDTEIVIEEIKKYFNTQYFHYNKLERKA
jgi:S-adenosylmethionine/arginine decarboxylase-like enzyme